MTRSPQTALFSFSGYLARLLMLLLVLSVPLHPAGAQEPQKFKDWLIRCLPENQRQNPQAPACVAEHVHVNPQTNKPELLIRAHFGGPDKLPAAVITVPLLVRIPPGLKLRIDDREILTLPYQVCLPTGCIAQFRLDSDLLSAFRKGTQGRVVVQLPTGKERGTPFSLLGFTAALNSLE